MTVIGLVLEGPFDFPVFEAFLQKELPARFHRPLKFRPLQPMPDATTGSLGGGGWSRVVGWCKNYSGEALQTFFSPLEETDEACDLILIHLDGDAMAHCSAHSTVVMPTEPCDAIARVETLTRMTLDWLAPTPEYENQLRFAFPVFQTEAWLLAALRPGERSWEDEADSKFPFQANRPRGRPILEFYQAQSPLAAADADVAAANSKSFAKFREHLHA